VKRTAKEKIPSLKKWLDVPEPTAAAVGAEGAAEGAAAAAAAGAAGGGDDYDPHKLVQSKEYKLVSDPDVIVSREELVEAH
jgi:hypothetical protein